MPRVTWYGVVLRKNGKQSGSPYWCVIVLSSCGCHDYSLVHGFLDRQDAHDMLQECAPGTFLIRFSQSQAGLSVAFKKCIYQCACLCAYTCVCVCMCV